MRCPKCKAINRLEALVCFKCGNSLHAPQPESIQRLLRPWKRTPTPQPQVPAWIWDQHREMLEKLASPRLVKHPFRILITRLGAALIDHVLVSVAFGLMLAAAWVILGAWPPLHEPAAVGQLGFVYLLIHYLYTCTFQVFTAATPGYWTVRLAVVTFPVQEPGMSFRRVSLRWFALWLTLLPFGLALWWALFDRDHLFLHDRWAKTRVIPLAMYNHLLDTSLKE